MYCVYWWNICRICSKCLIKSSIHTRLLTTTSTDSLLKWLPVAGRAAGFHTTTYHYHFNTTRYHPTNVAIDSTTLTPSPPAVSPTVPLSSRLFPVWCLGLSPEPKTRRVGNRASPPPTFWGRIGKIKRQKIYNIQYQTHHT